MSLVDVFPNEVTRMLFDDLSIRQRFSLSRVCSLWGYLVKTFPTSLSIWNLASYPRPIYRLFIDYNPLLTCNDLKTAISSQTRYPKNLFVIKYYSIGASEVEIVPEDGSQLVEKGISPGRKILIRILPKQGHEMELREWNMLLSDRNNNEKELWKL